MSTNQSAASRSTHTGPSPSSAPTLQTCVASITAEDTCIRPQLSELTTLKVTRASKRSPGASSFWPVIAGGAERLTAFGIWLTGSMQKKSLPGGL